jgi:hypothetical protein
LYPVDYFVWDKKNNPAWRLDRFELPVVASFGDFTVYSFEQK